MTKETKRMKFEDFASQLSDLLESLARSREPLVVEKEGKDYLVQASGPKDRGHDPAKVRRMLARTAGSFRGVDRRQLMKDIHAARQQSSKGRPA